MGRRTTAPPALDARFAVPLRGVSVDAQTRCAHYDGPTDVVALRAGCCGVYHPCHACHDETADHASRPWPRARFSEPSVLCGACGTTMTAPAYLASGHECPACGAPFNPGCAAHRDLYIEPAPPGG
ncbi:CHY zinc finger protein [Rubrivirga sp. S365]|uniref:CHY zinc finger protein n=1 Tax=Rubrivirga litoralis TaxID=3075598 RepID=A0ABU3BQF5_9BACT|nr:MULTISPECIES: CHY zinc finger protein [unclassified Rubrivirga]MDT0631503.1 CHY zinc finger protein [Rubrivirga sp. F394]MDT7855514.1 CHY zinc finger protein [Rubrivirga sp. S365]